MRFRNKGPGLKDLPASATLISYFCCPISSYTNASAYYLAHGAAKHKMGKYIKPPPQNKTCCRTTFLPTTTCLKVRAENSFSVGTARSEHCIAFGGQTAITIYSFSIYTINISC